MKNHFYNSLFFIYIVFSTITSFYAQPWIGDNWEYRRLVTIANPGSTSLTDFQVRINLDNTFDFANANSDGSDLRVTSSDGISQIHYWIESWNIVSEEATIWVKVPSLPIAGTTIYLYYGNSTATTTSNGTNTFNFFDDFSTYSVSGQNWIRRLEYSAGTWGPNYVTHDWKYSSEMMNGALHYSFRNRDNGWNLESLNTELEQELSYIHSQISATGTMLTDPGGYLTAEPRYCYGLILSNLALGFQYFQSTNTTLATRCYNDMILLYDRLRTVYPSAVVSDAGGSSWLLYGFSNAWKVLNDYDATRATQCSTIIRTYAATFLANQSADGSWTGQNGVQEHLKRNFAMLWALDVLPHDSTYLESVRDNMEYILATFWIPSNGGLEWYSNPASSDHFYECHQMWFMISARALNGRSGGLYDYTSEGLQAWHFLTDNNYTNIDMYIHNYTNHNAFFSYRQITSGGSIQVDSWKGSYEIGTALWGMSLNYDWVSNYQSSHSAQPFNYLDMMVKQIKNSPSTRGYFSQGTFYPSSTLWSNFGTPTVSITQHNGNYVSSFTGTGSHDNYIKSILNFNDFVLEMKVLLMMDINNNCTPEVGFRVTNNANRYITMLRGEAINDLFIRRYQGGVQTNPPTYPPFNYSANQYYKYKITANGTSIGQYIDDNLIRTWNDAGSTIISGGICLTNYGGTTSNPVYYDDVRIRSYSTVEPTATVGEQETNPLPVELSSLSAIMFGSTVKLNWRTETEVNNYGFEIERSKSLGSGGEMWKKIGFVNGNCNSSSPKTYTFEDNNLSAGKYSYRLKQIDNDGQFEYSKVINVDFNSTKVFELTQNYPNPFNPKTTLRFNLTEGGNVNLTIFNAIGQEVKTILNEYRESGTHIINIDGSELNSGIYLYKLESGSFVQTRKMILLK